MFVLHDFDWVMPYGSLYWGLDEPGVDHLGPAPQARPKFKWIGFIGQLLRHSDWTIDQQTADLRREIDKAMALGYDVLLVRLAHVDLDQLERETGMVASRRQLAALQATLQHDYVAEPAFTDPVMGSFDRLTTRQPGLARPFSRFSPFSTGTPIFPERGPHSAPRPRLTPLAKSGNSKFCIFR